MFVCLDGWINVCVCLDGWIDGWINVCVCMLCLFVCLFPSLV